MGDPNNTKGIGFSAPSPKPSPRLRKTHILAIAIDKYTNGPAPLSYPVTECERLIQLLIQKYEFEERHIINRLYDGMATQENLYDELYNLEDKLNADHNLILIFSGHGHLDEKKGEGYWLPVDAPKLNNPRDMLKYISLDQVLKTLAKVEAHHILLIVDSCFAGKFAQGTLELPQIDIADRNNPNETPSRWVLTSGRLEPVPDKSEFAEAIFDVLNGQKSSSLFLQDVYTAVRKQMDSRKVKQVPQCSDIIDEKFRGGEFAFCLREGFAQTDQAPAPELITQADLLQRLLQGSRDYLAYLKKGRFAKLQFEKILLPETEAELLDIDVHLEEEKTPFRQALEQLWTRYASASLESPHTLLCGEGGMSKTISCVRLWEELLEEGENAPLPIFIPLNEYNAATEEERKSQNYLYRFIAREYLDDSRLTPELVEALNKLFRANVKQPNALLLLDGFNEITLEKTPLMVQLIEFVRPSKGVQIAVTSRYEMRNFEWTHGFNRLDLLALRREQVEGYLEGKKLRLPGQAEVQELLQNPMMLSLFAGSSQLARQFEGDGRFSFKAHVSSKGELLHNFIEGQLAKYWLDNTRNPHREEEFLWQAFLFRHLLPFLAWRMVEEGRFFIHTRKSLDPAFNFKLVVEEAYHYLGSFDFTDLFHEFEGKRKSLGFGFAGTDFDAVEERNRRIRQYLVEKLFQLVEEGDTFRFLHQNFRDYFAAIHVQRTMEEAIAHNRDLPLGKRVFPETMRKAPIDYFVRQLLGELEGEHTNEIGYEDEKGWHWSKGQFFLDNNLSKFLETCRGVFDRERLGYATWNVLTILKEKRGDFSGADLNGLDFDRFSFNFLTNSRPSFPAGFCHGGVEEEGFFPQGHSASVNSAAFSSDGARIITASLDETAKVWDASSGQCILTLQGHSYAVRSAAFSPDGARIITASEDRTAKVWDAFFGQCILTLQDDSGSVRSAAFSADGAKIITAFSDQTKVWDAFSGQCILTLHGHSDSVGSAVFSADGARIITASEDKTVKVWDAFSGQCILTLQGFSDSVRSAAFSPDGARIITVSYDQTAKIWDGNSGQCILTLQGHSDWVLSAAFSLDGAKIITASEDKTSKVWDANSGQCILTLHGHSASIGGAAFSPDGAKIITASDDQAAKVWDGNSGQCILTLQGYSESVLSAAFSPNGDRIITASDDLTAKVWDAFSGQCILTLQGYSDSVLSAAFSPDGAKIITASYDLTAKVWDAFSGQCILTLQSYSERVLSAAFSPDGARIITVSDGQTVKVWDAISGQSILSLQGHSYRVLSAAFSPDGARITTASSDQTAKVWDAFSGQNILTLEGHSNWVLSAAFSPDGARIITASEDKTSKVWDASSGQCILTLEGHSYAVRSAAYSPEGARIITASYGQTPMVWDAISGLCILTLQGHSGSLRSAAFSPDGTRIITASDDRTVKVWNAFSGQCILTLPNIPGLFIQGCDFRNLYPGSKLSEENKDIMRQYGGIFDDEDARRWEDLMERHFERGK